MDTLRIGKFFTISIIFHLWIACLAAYLFSIETNKDKSIRINLITPAPIKEKKWVEIDFSPKTIKEEKPKKDAMLSWNDSRTHSKKTGKRHRQFRSHSYSRGIKKQKTSSVRGIEAAALSKETKANIKNGFAKAAPYVLKKEVKPIPLKKFQTVDSDMNEKEDNEPISLDTREFKYMEYFSTIKKKIDLVWVSPMEALLGGAHGNVVVQIHMNKDGTLESSSIYLSSGFEPLDKESLRAIEDASPFKPIPNEIGKESLNIIATFTYDLGLVAQ